MDSVKCLIDRWILEYEAYELWKKFSDNLRITQTWQTMYFLNFMQTKTIYNSLGMDQQDDTEMVNLMLLKIMTSISSASKLPNDSSTEITPLEEALTYVDQLSEYRLKEAVKAALMKFKKSLKQESVIICLRCHKLNLGKTVFDRVWSGSSNNSKDSSIKLSLEMLFKDDVNLSSALNQFSVTELSESCKQFFTKHFNTSSLPFLIQVGEKIIDTYPSTFGLASKKKKMVSEITKYKHFLIQCWLAEYFCYLAWMHIDDLKNEKYEWLIKFVSENNDFESKNCLFIRLMFKYSERNKTDDGMVSFTSPSEQCLELLEKINNSFPDDFEDSIQLITSLKAELKRFAVLIWSSRNMYSKARMVYEKLFNNSKDQELNSEISNILNGSFTIQGFSDVKLDKAFKNYLSKVLTGNSPLYLIYVAENIIGKSKNLLENLDLTVKKPIESSKRMRTSKKLPDDFVSSDSIEEVKGTRGRKSNEFKRLQSLMNESSDDDDSYKVSDKSYDPSFSHKVKKVEKLVKLSDKKSRVWPEEDL